MSFRFAGCAETSTSFRNLFPESNTRGLFMCFPSSFPFDYPIYLSESLSSIAVNACLFLRPLFCQELFVSTQLKLGFDSLGICNPVSFHPSHEVFRWASFIIIMWYFTNTFWKRLDSWFLRVLFEF